MNSIIKDTIDLEGGYVDNPNDSGGKTKYGITEKRARSFGYMGDMKELTREIANDILTTEDWNWINGDAVDEVSNRIADEIFDTAVNCGAITAGKFLQKALNALSYTRLDVDGIIGEKTIELLKDYIDIRGEDVLLKSLNCLQGAYYLNLAEKRSKDKVFIHGWLNKRIKF